MALIGDDDLAAAATALAGEARAAATRLDEQRGALARSALVWWHGGAARAYEQMVRERVTALALLSRRWSELADSCDAIAAQARVPAVADGGGTAAAARPS